MNGLILSGYRSFMRYDGVSDPPSPDTTPSAPATPKRALAVTAVLAMAVCAVADLATLPAAPVYALTTGYPAAGYTTSQYTGSGYTASYTAARTASDHAARILGAAHRSAALGRTGSAGVTAPGHPPAESVPNNSTTSTSAAEQTSTNWAGYAATGGSYTSVAANWTEPSVNCTTRGVVAFWVGLDGWGSDSVEQDGTGVDCTSGSPVQFAWWETYPGNSIVQYDKPVAAGDQLSSSVTSKPGGEYDLVLTDSTQGWTETTPAQVSGARNASAEFVTEAVTSSGSVSPLPEFQTADFTAARIDGGSPQAADAEPIEMADTHGDELAAPGPMDDGGDFSVEYLGQSSGASPSTATRQTTARPQARKAPVV